MPTQRNQDYLNIAIRRQALLERVKSGQVRDYLKELKKLEALIREALLSLETDIGDLSRTKLNGLLSQLRADQGIVFKTATTAFLGDTAKIAAMSASQEVIDLNKTVDLRGTKLNEFTNKELFRRVINRPLTTNGDLLEPWVKNFTNTEINRVNNTIRAGWAQGKTNQQLVQQIIGTKAKRYKDGVLETTRRNASTVVRTSVQHAASAARQETWEANPDVIEKYEWVSTLDSVTSKICRTLDGEQFEFGKGPVPPIHPNSVKAGTTVTTRRGLVPIEHVRVGDKVLTHMGRYRKVYAVMAKKCDTPMVDLINGFGESVSLTDDHPILTQRGWVNAGEIKRGDTAFQNFTQFANSENRLSRPEVKKTVLVDAHNVKTQIRQELITLGIFGFSTGMTASVKLKGDTPEVGVRGRNTEIDNVRPNNLLKAVGNFSFLKKFFKHSFVGRGVLSEVPRFSPRRLFGNVLSMNRVVGLHTFGRSLGTFGVPFRVLAAPMVFPSWFRDILGVCPDRVGLTTDGQSVLDSELSQGVIGKAVFPFQKAKTHTGLPMCFNQRFVKVKAFFGQFFTHKDKPTVMVFNYADNMSIVDKYSYKGFVFNLSVEEDETYIAGSYLVHNCRSTTIPVLNEKFDFLSKGRTRSAEDGPVSAKTSYYDWLKRQDKKTQVDVLGPTRAKLFREGGLSAERFRALQFDKNFEPLTLDEMAKMEPAAFKKAGL
jgi:SPP1 gp7 family putative phage head morphogenesis protein